MFYVYLLLNKMNKQNYIGSTNDLKKRFTEHNEGKVISTKRYRPWVLFYYEAYISEKLARLREKRLKHNGNTLRELKNRIGLVKSGAGFTLIELLVVMSIISILTAVALPSYNMMRNNATLNSDAQELISNLRLAQSQAMSAQDGLSWGVRLEADRYIIYGGDWSAPQYQKVHTLKNGIQIIQGANTEVVFKRLYGTTADATISIGFNGGKQKTVKVDSIGKISQL
jgi:putative endonuclease